MENEWRPIAGHPGYEVSADGRVRSWRPANARARPRTEPKVLSPWANYVRADGADDWFTVRLRAEDGRFKSRNVRALVREAFGVGR